MVDERAYWVWLQQGLGVGSRKPALLHSQYPGGVREFCEGGPRLWNTRRDLTDKEAAALQSFSLSQAAARLEYAEKMGWLVLVPTDREYPDLLRNIPNPPAVLYVQGDLPEDEGLPVAVAGSRKAGRDVLDAARRIGFELASGGARVVSGEAVGVDSAALTGAMTVPGGRVVSVLPVSLDSPYLVENARLRRTIRERGGALVTEYFSQQQPGHGTFPLRNRLITGLSRGVVLLQAAKKSGTMLYSQSALDQNRDVFVVPGPRDDPRFAGSWSLIDDGAKPVLNGEDVLSEYGGPRGPRRPTQEVAALEGLFSRPPKTPERREAPALRDAPPDLAPQARRVWESLASEPLSVAELSEKTGLSASALLGILTELELEGLARSLPGKRYARGF